MNSALVVTVGHDVTGHPVLLTEHIACYHIDASVVSIQNSFEHYREIYQEVTSHTEVDEDGWSIWLNDGGLVEGRIRKMNYTLQPLAEHVTRGGS